VARPLSTPWRIDRVSAAILERRKPIRRFTTAAQLGGDVVDKYNGRIFAVS
jgi:hypothetical protein